MPIRLYLYSLLVLVMYMTVWFVIARIRRRLDTVDLAWGGGFFLVALMVAVVEPNVRTNMIVVLVAVWAARLTWHILKRNKQDEEDPRYADMAKNWKRYYWLRAYALVFLLQAVLISLIGLPVLFAAGTLLPHDRWLFTLGYTVWVIGFFYEYYADKQLAAFRADPANKDKVLDSGLWRYSRHPNYFGELTMWWGIGLIAMQTSWGWVGLAGPLLLSVLLRYVTGVPPVEKRRAKDKKYQTYVKQTSPIIPWFVDDTAK